MGCQCSTARAIAGAGPPLAVTSSQGGDPLSAIKDTPDGVKVDYVLGDLLGKGSFGNVYRAVHKKSKEVCAIKVMDRNKIKATSIHREWNVLEHTGHHPFVVDYKGTYKTKDSVSFVLEFMSGGELFDRLIRRGAYAERDARVPFRRIAEALAYLHKRGIVHRDLKPENILLKDDSENPLLKIADFGLSQLIGPNERLLKICGTWAYAAPEMSDPARPGYDCRFDCFSFGVILYVVLSGSHPFDAQGNAPVHEIKARARAAQFDFQGDEWRTVSDVAKDLIRRLIVKDPEQRLDSTTMLSHKWFTDKTEPIYELVPVVAGDESKVVCVNKGESKSPTQDNRHLPRIPEASGAPSTVVTTPDHKREEFPANKDKSPHVLTTPDPHNSGPFPSNNSTVFVRTMSPEGSNSVMIHSPLTNAPKQAGGMPTTAEQSMAPPVTVSATASRMMGLKPGMTVQIVAGEDGSLHLVPAGFPGPASVTSYHGHAPPVYNKGMPIGPAEMDGPSVPSPAMRMHPAEMSPQYMAHNKYVNVMMQQPDKFRVPDPSYVMEAARMSHTNSLPDYGYYNNGYMTPEGYPVYNSVHMVGMYHRGAPGIPGQMLSGSHGGIGSSHGGTSPSATLPPGSDLPPHHMSDKIRKGVNFKPEHSHSYTDAHPKGMGPVVALENYQHEYVSSQVIAQYPGIPRSNPAAAREHAAHEQWLAKHGKSPTGLYGTEAAHSPKGTVYYQHGVPIAQRASQSPPSQPNMRTPVHSRATASSSKSPRVDTPQFAQLTAHSVGPGSFRDHAATGVETSETLQGYDYANDKRNSAAGDILDISADTEHAEDTTAAESAGSKQSRQHRSPKSYQRQTSPLRAQINNNAPNAASMTSMVLRSVSCSSEGKDRDSPGEITSPTTPGAKANDCGTGGTKEVYDRLDSRVSLSPLCVMIDSTRPTSASSTGGISPKANA